VQKLPDWTQEVKRLSDEDTAAGRDVRAVVLGSAPLLIARELTESLAGRFEVTRLGHWRYAEMREALDFSLEQFIFHGGYPGAASLVSEGFSLRTMRAVPDQWGRLVESAVGAELLARHQDHSSLNPKIYYWQEGGHEVDFVVPQAGDALAMEVKSGRSRSNISGLDGFCAAWPGTRPMVVGTGGIALANRFAA